MLDVATGELLPRFGREDAVPMRNHGVREGAQWRERRWADVSATGVDRVKLRFRLYGASRLCGFSFAA